MVVFLLQGVELAGKVFVTRRGATGSSSASALRIGSTLAGKTPVPPRRRPVHFFCSLMALNPIRPLACAGGVINCRMASKTTLS